MSKKFKRSVKINAERIDQIHVRLGKIQVTLPRDPDAASLRDLFADIREHRNSVSIVLAALLPRLAGLKGEAEKVGRVIEAEAAKILDSGAGLYNATNEKLRQARIKLILSSLYETRTAIRVDLMLIEEAVNHARMTREELRSAFEEGSRSLFSLELEYRVERSAP